MFDPYKWLWKRIGGRPWTYIMRDFAYQNPIFLVLGFFLVGFVLGKYFHWSYVVPIFGGILLGHLFWGTKWRKHEGEIVTVHGKRRRIK
jgi:O-antigen/teichoic acid export membrane protein